MAWLNLLGMAVKTGAHIYKNRQESKMLMSDAQRLHAEKMAKGQIDYQGKLLEARQSDWKDVIYFNFALSSYCTTCVGLFSDDPTAMDKMQLFFQYFSELPFWYQTIFVGVIASVYGLKATDLIKENNLQFP